ncbi:MAG: P-II family nitrogen regulator [Planctomycetes bacterium]|nr:P-II family nitrogen regulator [Planctomycetota bacterium]
MKKVIAFVKPFKAQSVLDALCELEVECLTFGEVRGYGRQKGHLELYQGSEYAITFLPKVRIELFCEDFRLNDVTDAIVKKARTGRIGDGKILVLNTEKSDEDVS